MRVVCVQHESCKKINPNEEICVREIFYKYPTFILLVMDNDEGIKQ